MVRFHTEKTKQNRKMKMKKIMITALVAGLALASQAAQLDWKYSATSANQGETVYVILGATAQTSWESLAAIESAAVNYGVVENKGRGAYAATGSFSSDAVSETSANVYYVVVSADKSTFAVTSVADMKSSVYDPAAQQSSPGQNTMLSSTSITQSGLTFGGSEPVVPPPTGVPEPTSGLLMLVGLGALALRRKRA